MERVILTVRRLIARWRELDRFLLDHIGPVVFSSEIQVSHKGERLVLRDLENGIFSRDFSTLAHVQRYLFSEKYCRSKMVLDLGCGTGYGAAYLARKGAFFVLGVDRSRLAIGYAKKHHRGENVEFAIMDAATLGLRPAFETSTCFDLLEHVGKPETAIRELSRVVAESSISIIGTPNRDVSKRDNPHHVSELSFDDFLYSLSLFFPRVKVLGQDLVVGGKRLGENWRNTTARLSIHSFAIVGDGVNRCYGLLAICNK